MLNIERLTALSQACQMLTVVTSAKARELSATLLRRYMSTYRGAKDKKRKC